jgi:hypothetical protein
MFRGVRLGTVRLGRRTSLVVRMAAFCLSLAAWPIPPVSFVYARLSGAPSNASPSPYRSDLRSQVYTIPDINLIHHKASDESHLDYYYQSHDHQSSLELARPFTITS